MASLTPWRNNLVLIIERKPSRFDLLRFPRKTPDDFRRADARREIERRQIEKETI